VSQTFVFAGDGGGNVYCLDKSTGKMHWRHEMFGAILGTPLVVGDILYVADEDSEVEVLRASAKYEHIAIMSHQWMIQSSPIFADDALFIVSGRNVFAIGKCVVLPQCKIVPVGLRHTDRKSIGCLHSTPSIA